MNNHSNKRLAEIEELLRMTALQTTANARQLAINSKQIAAMATEHNREMKGIRADLRQSRKEHDREMKEIRALFKRMIERLTV